MIPPEVATAVKGRLGRIYDELLVVMFDLGAPHEALVGHRHLPVDVVARLVSTRRELRTLPSDASAFVMRPIMGRPGLVWHACGKAPRETTKRAGRRPSEGASGLRVSSERVTRIELAFSAWEADVLPLNYTRVRRRTVASTSAQRGIRVQVATGVNGHAPTIRTR